MRDDTIIVVAGTLGDKATIAASCGKQAVKKGAHAGNLVRAVAKIAGRLLLRGKNDIIILI